MYKRMYLQLMLSTTSGLVCTSGLVESGRASEFKGPEFNPHSCHLVWNMVLNISQVCQVQPKINYSINQQHLVSSKMVNTLLLVVQYGKVLPKLDEYSITQSMQVVLIQDHRH